MRTKTINIVRGAFGQPSVPFLLSRRGALTHHPEGAVVFPAEIVRSPRGIAASAEASRQCHSTCGRCCHRLRRSQLFPFWKQSAPCPHKPATGSFVCGYDPMLDFGSFSLLRKRNRKRKNEVNKIWRFIIWRRRWSVGAQGAPPWPLPLI